MIPESPTPLASLPNRAADLIASVLGSLPAHPGPNAAWRLHGPSPDADVTITVRPTLGPRGAVWFESGIQGKRGQAEWWVPLEGPDALDRIHSHVDALLDSGVRLTSPHDRPPPKRAPGAEAQGRNAAAARDPADRARSISSASDEIRKACEQLRQATPPGRDWPDHRAN